MWTPGLQRCPQLACTGISSVLPVEQHARGLLRAEGAVGDVPSIDRDEEVILRGAPLGSGRDAKHRIPEPVVVRLGRRDRCARDEAREQSEKNRALNETPIRSQHHLRLPIGEAYGSNP